MAYMDCEEQGFVYELKASGDSTNIEKDDDVSSMSVLQTELEHAMYSLFKDRWATCAVSVVQENIN